MPRRFQVEKKIMLDRNNCEWFEATYPEGSYTWLFNMILQKFRDLHEITPEDLIQKGIEELKRSLES